jgi:surfeit locus 1 family protein
MKNLLTGRWLIRHVLVLIVFIILINLGLWQLRRLEQRRALNASILAGLNAPVVLLTGEEVDPDELHRQRVSVTGTFDNEAAIAIRNRPFQGQPGVHLVVPLKIKDSDWAVMVDRGWIPQKDAVPERWSRYDLTDDSTVNGVAYPSQPRPEGYWVPTDPTPSPGQPRLDTWFRVDIERIQEQVDYPLLPIFIEQSAEPGTTTNDPPLQEDNINVKFDEGPHLSYAVQWFSFALVLVVTYAAFIWQELKRQHSTQ